MSADDTISIKEAWVAAGGHEEIQPSKLDLLIALRQMDQACKEAESLRIALQITAAELEALKLANAARTVVSAPADTTGREETAASLTTADLDSDGASELASGLQAIAALREAFDLQRQLINELKAQLAAERGADASPPTTEAMTSSDGQPVAVAQIEADSQAASPPKDTATAVGQLIHALGVWKQTTPQTAPPAWANLVDACAGMVAAARDDAGEPAGRADGWRVRALPQDENAAAKRMRERFEAQHGALSDVMACANALCVGRESFREAFNRHREQPITEDDVEAAQSELAAAVRAYARWAALHPTQAPAQGAAP